MYLVASNEQWIPRRLCEAMYHPIKHCAVWGLGSLHGNHRRTAPGHVG